MEILRTGRCGAHQHLLDKIGITKNNNEPALLAEFIFETNEGQYITRVTSNCSRYLQFSSASHTASALISWLYPDLEIRECWCYLLPDHHLLSYKVAQG